MLKYYLENRKELKEFFGLEEMIALIDNPEISCQIVADIMYKNMCKMAKEKQREGQAENMAIIIRTANIDPDFLKKIQARLDSIVETNGEKDIKKLESFKLLRDKMELYLQNTDLAEMTENNFENREGGIK